MNTWMRIVAGRYTLSGGMSLMSAVSAAGLVVGVAVLILVLSVVNGFERELRDRVLSLLPHGVIEGRAPIKDYPSLMSRVQTHPEILASAPYVSGSGLLVNNHKVSGIVYAGVEPALESQVSTIGDFLVEGDMHSLNTESWSMVMGAGLAAEMNVSTGDTINLVLPEFRYSLGGPLPRLKQFRVTGIFKAGADMDNNQVFIHIRDAQALRRIQGAMGLRLKVVDMFDAPRVIYEIRQAIREPELSGKSWFATHGNLYNAIRTQKSTMFLLLFLLIAVAAFNVVSNLMMTVNEKEADIAILKTMGATPKGILMVFLCHGAMLGFSGVLAGLTLGIVLAMSASHLFSWFESTFAPGVMNQYFIHYLPTEILMADVLVVALAAFVICLGASVYPALKAAKSLPVETLQYA